MTKIYQHYKGGLYNYFGDAVGIDEHYDDLKLFCHARLKHDSSGPYRVVKSPSGEFFVVGLKDSITRCLYQSLEDDRVWLRPVGEFTEKFKPYPSKIILGKNCESATFFCPGCKEFHTVSLASGGWLWSGGVDRPSFMPSIMINTGDKVCHSFVTDGKIRFLTDCTHSLKGREVELPII